MHAFSSYAHTTDLERSQHTINELRKRLVEADCVIDFALGKKRLTRREAQVLKLLAEGASSKEMAVMLGIGIKTVEVHRTNLLHKFGVHDCVRLTHCALRLGYAKL